MKEKIEKPGERTAKRLQLLDKFKRAQQQRAFRKLEDVSKRLKRNVKDEARLNYGAIKLAKKWPYRKLMQAADERKGATKGRDVHGWMEMTFPDYEWLVANDVLDRACYLAQLDFKPDVFTHVKGMDLTKMHRSLVLLPKATHFDHEDFNEFEFDRIVIYSKEPLEKSLNWIEGYPYPLDGYDTKVTLGPANLLNLGLALWDLPVALVKDTPGKNREFFTARVSSTDLTKERDDLIRKFVYKARVKEKDAEEIRDELKIESQSARRMYADLKHKMLSRAPFTDEKEFERFEKQYYTSKRPKLRVNWKKLTISLIFIVVAVLIIITITNAFLRR